MDGEQKHFESLYPDTAFSIEVERLLSFIKGGNSCQLIGAPGVGRSDLLKFLAYNKQVRDKYLGENSKYAHFVAVDFSEMQKRPLFDVMKFLFLSLADSLRNRGMTEEFRMVNDSFKETLAFGDELVLFQELKQVVDFLALEKKMTLIFLFNRFEEYVPSVSGDFFRNLRILRDRAKYRFSVVFSVNRPLEALLDPLLFSDFYEYVADNLVFLRLYDESVSDFLISYLEKLAGRRLDKGLRGDILSLTGGFSKIMRLSVESCLANDVKGLKSDNLLGFLLSQKPVVAALKDVWLSLMPAEQSDIRSNSFGDPVVDEYLDKTGLVKQGKLQVVILGEYVRASGEGKNGAESGIVYDENTNSIKKGEVVLSDSLTSSEFRLLKYLLQNEDRVIERDEMISVVWQGVKSTAGITDQAVDQLIFRLRRKIEEDPNKPHHLQTVKGRGFRFVG